MWAIVVGVMFYLLSRFFDLTAIFLTIFLTSIFYTTVSELMTKTFDVYMRRSILVYPLGYFLAYVMNLLAPKFFYALNDPYGLVYSFLILMMLVVLTASSSLISTLIARLAIGYEALIEEPIVKSYLMTSKTYGINTLLEDFLQSLNIVPEKTLTGTQTSLKFLNGRNQHFLFANPMNNDSTEVNLITWRWEIGETLVDPNKEDLSIFLLYFESFLEKQKLNEKLGEWTSKFRKKHAKNVKDRIWKRYTFPLQLREKLALRGLIAQKIIAFVKAHKTAIYTFVGGVLTVIIGEILIRYIMQTIGI